jgi:pimeloyl-ACP methyl ester carboxylesterase
MAVLVHGSRDHARSWDWTARALVEKGWRVIAPDLRGHGDSAWSPDGAYLTSYQVQDLADLIEQLAVPRLSIIGHSFGGTVSARYAAMFPEHVARLVLIDGMGPGPEIFAKWKKRGSVARSREWLQQRKALMAKPPRIFSSIDDARTQLGAGNPALSSEQADHLTRHGLRETSGGWIWKSDPLMTYFPPEDYHAETDDVWTSLACPTLLFRGGKSFTVDPISDGRCALIKDCRSVSYEDAGHWLHHERFDAFIAELKEFLAREV